MVRLVIKGSKDDAWRAADQRGISLGNLRELHDETVAECADSEMIAVARWFGEPVKCRAGEGFPRGSLLFYS